jgi:hypothetical protein
MSILKKLARPLAANQYKNIKAAALRAMENTPRAIPEERPSSFEKRLWDRGERSRSDKAQEERAKVEALRRNSEELKKAGESMRKMLEAREEKRRQAEAAAKSLMMEFFRDKDK